MPRKATMTPEKALEVLLAARSAVGDAARLVKKAGSSFERRENDLLAMVSDRDGLVAEVCGLRSNINGLKLIHKRHEQCAWDQERLSEQVKTLQKGISDRDYEIGRLRIEVSGTSALQTRVGELESALEFSNKEKDLQTERANGLKVAYEDAVTQRNIAAFKLEKLISDAEMADAKDWGRFLACDSFKSRLWWILTGQGGRDAA